MSRSTSPIRGIGLMCLALAVFSCLDTTAKYMATLSGLPITQVVWVRFLSQLVVILFVVGVLALPRLLETRKLGFQLARSTLMLLSTVLNFIALQHLRLDQTQTVAFLAPFVVALLGGPFLGEWVGWRRFVAILVGFSGILVVLRPGVATLDPAMLFAFGSMLCYSVFILITRYLATYDAPEVTLFYSLIAGTILMAPFAISDWIWPTSGKIWLLLVSMGFWGGLGHYIFILAHRWAPAPVIAPFMYVQLLSMTGAGYVLFGDVPDVFTLAGALVIIASGLYLLYREQKLKGGP